MPIVEGKNLKSTQIDSVLQQFKFEYEDPVIVDSSAFQILIPLSVVWEGKNTRGSGSLKYKEEVSSGYWNLLFYNAKTEETHLLTQNKMKILDILGQYERGRIFIKLSKNQLLYKIQDIDFNKDKKLNFEDPAFLFVSDLNGRNLQRLSPKNEDVQDLKFLPIWNRTEFLMITLRDTNKDLKFDAKDEEVWYKVEFLNQKWSIKEIFDTKLQKEIKHLFFNKWLKK